MIATNLWTFSTTPIMTSASLLLSLLVLLAMAAASSAAWCICKQGVSDAVLQKTLDYACGAGADCNPTRQSGPCFNPNTVRAHCSYAVNSYFQRNRQAPAACDFSATAALVASDPSTAGCAYPATATATATATGTTTTPTTAVGGNPTTTTPNGGSPLVTTPTTGVLGGVNNVPTPGFNNNLNVARILLPKTINLFYMLPILML